MIAARKLVLLLGLGSLAPAVAHATTAEQAYLASCRKDPGLPVPVAVVSPRIGAEYVGAQVDLEFTVNEQGKPVGFRVASCTDDALIQPVVDAVRQWRFRPAESDGKPVPARVMLPVKIRDPLLTGPAMAANSVR